MRHHLTGSRPLRSLFSREIPLDNPTVFRLFTPPIQNLSPLPNNFPLVPIATTTVPFPGSSDEESYEPGGKSCLLINFTVTKLKTGIKRFVLQPLRALRVLRGEQNMTDEQRHTGGLGPLAADTYRWDRRS